MLWWPLQTIFLTCPSLLYSVGAKLKYFRTLGLRLGSAVIKYSPKNHPPQNVSGLFFLFNLPYILELENSTQSIGKNAIAHLGPSLQSVWLRENRGGIEEPKRLILISQTLPFKTRNVGYTSHTIHRELGYEQTS